MLSLTAVSIVTGPDYLQKANKLLYYSVPYLLDNLSVTNWRHLLLLDIAVQSKQNVYKSLNVYKNFTPYQSRHINHHCKAVL